MTGTGWPTVHHFGSPPLVKPKKKKGKKRDRDAVDSDSVRGSGDTVAAEVNGGPVQHPAHYQHPSGIEVIEIIKQESFLRGNIIKYVLRAPFKGSELQDLEKAQQYLQWEIERVKNG